MSGMRPTFVAFSMCPTAIIEFVRAKNPTLQKRGGKLQKTVCFENLLLAAFIIAQFLQMAQFGALSGTLDRAALVGAPSMKTGFF